MCAASSRRLIDPTALTASILAVLFVASLVRSTFGFGEALVAMPLLLFFVHKERAVHLPDRSVYAFGFAAGMLGSAYNAAGPPLVAFGTLPGWTPQRFRATSSSNELFVRLVHVGLLVVAAEMIVHSVLGE